jgi:alkylated DNA repair protein alkB homolog 1
MAVPAMPCGQEFKPEAAIVNYYGPSMLLLSSNSLMPFPCFLKLSRSVEVTFSFPYLYYNIDIWLIIGDMLGGHVDDMEKDWTKPIVSIRYYSPASYIIFP